MRRRAGDRAQTQPLHCELRYRRADEMLIDKVLYRTQVTATGGRDTPAVSSDDVLDLKLTTPRELDGTSGRGVKRHVGRDS